jgi:hypothetical protein
MLQEVHQVVLQFQQPVQQLVQQLVKQEVPPLVQQKIAHLAHQVQIIMQQTSLEGAHRRIRELEEEIQLLRKESTPAENASV